MFQKYLFRRYLCLCLLASLLLCACSPREVTTNKDHEKLPRCSNSDIGWDAQAGVLVPFVISQSCSTVLQAADTSQLLAMLKELEDPNRYVFAHVFLTTATGAVIDNSSNRWNGLLVDIRADGTPIYDEADTDRLRRLWIAWLAAQE